jgi:hypothetical protein
MTWNYRIIEFSDYRALHEVHYDEKGRPWAYTSEPREFVESLDEDDAGAIVADLEIALSDAQRLPVLGRWRTANFAAHRVKDRSGNRRNTEEWFGPKGEGLTAKPGRPNMIV